MEKLLAGALVLVGFGLLVVAAAIGSVVLRRWAASRADETDSRLADLEKSLDRLESRLKLLQGEWADYHTKLDSVVRRGVRLGVLERKDGEAAAPEAPPVTRSELLRRYRERKR